VASAVIVRDASFSCAIDDSKKLSPASREVAYREILQKAHVAVSVKDHTVVDELNIFWASMAAMKDAVRRLPSTPDYVIVDGNHVPDFEQDKDVRRAALVKGDSKSLAIACASIVAKVTRDRIMEEYDKVYPQYGFKSHKGYCTREHVTALLAHGPTPIHRRSFEPVKSLVEGRSPGLRMKDCQPRGSNLE